MSSAEEHPSDGDNDLEIIEEGEEVENIQNQEVNVEETNENDENAEDGTKTVVKPKRVYKNPQPKLNEQTLKGPKGIAAIEGYFERVKFKGRGYEEQDLNVLMKTYEYWCHRLFPKFPFDDCIARLEKLGTKKATQTHIKRIRLDINFDDDKPLLSDEEVEGENNTGGFVDTYNDPFDQLLPTTASDPAPEMTVEQLERIRLNKERARHLREERLRKIRENTENNFGEISQLVTPSDQESNTSKVVAGSSQDVYERLNTNENGYEFESRQINTQDNLENSDINSTGFNGNYSQNDCKRTGSNNTNKYGNLFQQDSEDDMDTLELEEKTKKKKRIIESDSEDESQDNVDERLNENENRNQFVSTQINAQDYNETESSVINGTVSNGDYNRTDSNKTRHSNDNNTFQQDSEEITDTLDLEEKTTKKKKKVIESDSEDETIDEKNKNETVKNTNHNLEITNDEFDEFVPNTKSNKCTGDKSNTLNCFRVNNNDDAHSQTNAQMIDSQDETEENDIEDILNEINTDDNYPAKDIESM